MGFLDDIKKKAAEMTSTASVSIAAGLEGARKSVSEAVSKVSASTSEAAGKVGGKASCLASATGDFVVDAAKDMTGINAYKHYQAARQSREEADRIVKTVEAEVGKVRADANVRLSRMGEIRLSALRNTVGRFIEIARKLNQGVKDKEYELLSGIDITQEEIKELGIAAIDRKKMTKLIGSGAAASAAAAYGVRKAVMWGVGKFASASTGAAINKLSGAAAQKATMAWLGGGSVSAGGGGVALGASRLAMIGNVATGIGILTTVATVASLYYSHKRTEAAQYLANIKIWEAKTMSACELMKKIMHRSDEIAELTQTLEARCVEALDGLDAVAEAFDPQNTAHAKAFQTSALLVKSMSQLCQTPLIDETGELNDGLNAVVVSSEKILNKNL